MKQKKIIITGGSGYIAQMLAKKWTKDNTVILFTGKHQHPNNNFNKNLLSPHDYPTLRYRSWDIRGTQKDWATDLEGADLVLNLAGKTVNCRYHESNKQEVLSSRIITTNSLGEAIQKSTHPPKLWINMSSATIYTHSMDQAQDEINGQISDLKKDNMPYSFLDRVRFGIKKGIRQLRYGRQHAKVKDLDNDFSVSVCRQWESAFFSHRTAFTRKIAVRTAIVIGDGGVYTACYDLATSGLGGKQGSGKQKFSWIHEEDFARAIEFCVLHPEIEGIINVAAPEVSTNHEWMKLIRKAAGVRWGLSLPEWLLEIGAFFKGTETELILKSRWVVPGLLQKKGFTFLYPQITKAVEAISHLKLS